MDYTGGASSGETSDLSVIAFPGTTIRKNIIMGVDNQLMDDNDHPYGKPALDYSGDVSGASTNKGEFLYQTSYFGPDYDLMFRNLTFSITSVPEASTWAMMLGGFGLIGWTMRRRKAVFSIG